MAVAKRDVNIIGHESERTEHSRCDRVKHLKEDPSKTVMRQPRWAQIDDFTISSSTARTYR